MADGRLNRVYEFIFSGEDKVSSVVRTIEGQIESTIRRSKSFSKEITDLADEAKSKLNDLASISGKLKDAFKGLDTDISSKAFSKAAATAREYTDAIEGQYETLGRLREKMSEKGLDTQYIDVALKVLETEAEDLSATVGDLYNKHFKKLVDSFNNASSGAEKAAIQQQLYNDIMEAFGKDSQEAEAVYNHFIEQLQGGGSALGKIGSKFKSFFDSISKWTNGPSVLGGLVGGLVGAISSMGLSLAINAITAALQKGIKELTKWVKSWNEVKRAVNQGAGEAITATANETRELEYLNNKLKTLDKSSKEYARTKDSIISQFGKYYSGLEEELTRVGYLKDGYDQLKASILAANLERQRAEAINSLEKNYGADISKYLARERKAIFKALSDDVDRASELYKSLYSAVLTGSDVSGEDSAILKQIFGVRGPKALKLSRKLSRRVDEVNETWVSDMDMAQDYSQRQAELNRQHEQEQWHRDEVKRRQDYQNELAQMEINAMADGAAKQRAQARLDHERDIQELDQFTADYIQAAADAYEKYWKETMPSITYNPDFFWQNAGPSFEGLPTYNGAKKEGEEQAAERKKQSDLLLRRNLSNIGDQTRSQAYQYAEQIKENNKAVERAIIDAELENRSIRIEAMQDSTAKELAQLKLGHEQELEQLRRQKEDQLKQLQENEKTRWLAENPERKEYNFKTTITVDSEEFSQFRSQFEQQESLLNQAFESSKKDLMEKYGSLDERRKTLSDKWAKLIAEEKDDEVKAILEKERDSAIANFNYENIVDYGTVDQVYEALKEKIRANAAELADESQREIAMAAGEVELAQLKYGDPSRYRDYDKEREAIIAISDAEIRLARAKGDVVEAEALQSKRTEDLINLEERYSNSLSLVFGNVSKYTSAQLKEARRIASEYMDANRATMDPEQVQRFREAIDAINDAEFEKKFQVGNAGIVDLIKNYTHLKDLQKELEAEKDKGDKADKRRIEDLARQIEQEQEQLTLDFKATIADGIVKGLQTVVDLMKQLADAVGNETLGEAAAGMGAFAQNLSAAYEGFKSSGSWVGAVIGGVSDMATQAVQAFMQAEAETKKMKDNAEAFAMAMKLAELSVNKADYSGIFGSDRSGLLSAYANTSVKAFRSYREELDKLNSTDWAPDEFTKKWEGLGKDIFIPTTGILGNLTMITSRLTGEKKEVSKGFQAYQDAISRGMKGLQTMMVKTKDNSGFANFFGIQDEFTALGDLAPEIFGQDGMLDVENAKLFLQTNTQISEEQRKQIENAIELNEKYQEAREGMKDLLSGIFGDLSSLLADATLEGLETGAELGGDALKDKLTGSIKDLKKMMIEGIYARYFNQYQDQALEMLENGGNEEDLVSLYGEMIDKITDTAAIAQKAAEHFDEVAGRSGFNLEEEGDQRKAQTKSSLGASQDSVDESNARLTTIQAHTFEINENVKKIAEAATLSGVNAGASILPSFPAMEMPVVVDYTEELLRIREDLGTLAQNDDRFMAALAELQGTADGIRSSSDQVRDNTQGTNDLTGRIRSALDMVVDSGVKMK